MGHWNTGEGQGRMLAEGAEAGHSQRVWSDVGSQWWWVTASAPLLLP